MSSPQSSFAERWQRAAEKHGPFCLNLDPAPGLLRRWELPNSPEGLERFCQQVLEVAGPRLSAIKPQSAFFERFGAAGVAVLQRTLQGIRECGALAILDAKRGDIGSTNEGYALGLLGPDSPMGADALTLHAYLGFGALRVLVERAAATGCGLFPVVLSSNPEGSGLQNARLESGVTVAEGLAEEITACNRGLAGQQIGPIGAVVGVTATRAPALLERLPQSLVLAPGLGAQGGTVEDIALRFAGARGRVIPCAGRSVLEAGPDAETLGAALDEVCTATRSVLG